MALANKIRIWASFFRLVFIRATLLLILLSRSSYAQDCGALLAGGVFDISKKETDASTTTSFMHWFCDKKFSSQQEAENFGASAAFPFKGIPVQLGFSSEKTSWSSWYRSTCATFQSNFDTRQRVREYLQKTSSAIVEGFNSCLNQDGFHVWLEHTPDPSQFVLALKFVSPGPGITETKIRKIAMTPNIQCSDLPEVVSFTRRSLCTRSDAKAATIVVDAEFPPKTGATQSLQPIIEIPVEQVDRWGNAWEVFHIAASLDPAYKQKIEQFLRTMRPHPDGVYGALSGGNDFYIWARSDKDGPEYELKYIIPAKVPDWRAVVQEGLRAKRISIIGFNWGTGDGNAMWYLEVKE